MMCGQYLSCVEFLSCSTDEEGSPVIIYISKLFVTDKKTIPQYQTRFVNTVDGEVTQSRLLTASCRPLTETELAERREAARQRHQTRRAVTEGGTGEEHDNGAEQPAPLEPEVGVAEDEGGSVFLAFSRVFSGVVKRGQKLFVLQSHYDPRDTILDEDSDTLPPYVSQFTVGDMYVLMGRGVLPVDQVPAGNVVGIAGLEELVIKSATVSSSLACPAFGAMNIIAAPIVRVAIEPLHATDLRALVEGMKLLNQADPSVEVSVQETGEHVLAATGEVHLQKCLDDLENQYSRIKLKVSAPIIPFRETVVPPPTVDMVNEEISAENEVKLLTRPHPEHNASRLDLIMLRNSFIGGKPPH